MKNEISKCCKAPMSVGTVDEGTSCWICVSCKQPTDPFAEPPTANKNWPQELEELLDENFPKLNQSNPKIPLPNNRSQALVFYAQAKMLIEELLSDQKKEIVSIIKGIEEFEESYCERDGKLLEAIKSNVIKEIEKL